MRLFWFEWRKFSEKRLFLALLVIPIILLIILGAYYSLPQENAVRREEMNTAHSLVADLVWRAGAYERERGDVYGDYDPEVEDTLNEQEQEIYALVREAEQHRFNYSADAWNYEWASMNEAKQAIWEILGRLKTLGIEFLAVDGDSIETDKMHIDWLVEHNVDYLQPEQTKESLFLLNNGFNILLSLPAIFLIIFFFALPIFDETFTQKFNFTRVLPVSRTEIYNNKLKLFTSFIATYILVALLTTAAIHFLFDEVPLMAQLNYPIATQTPVGLQSKPLGEFLLWRIGFFILLTLVIFLIIYLLSIFISSIVFNTIILGFLSLIAMIIVQSNLSLYQAQNPLAWLDSSTFIILQNRQDLLAVLFSLIGATLILTSLVVFASRWVRRPRSKELRGLTNFRTFFLLRHEFLHFRRDKLLFYCTFGLVILATYMGTAGFQAHQARQATFHTNMTQMTEHFIDVENSRESIVTMFEDAADEEAMQDVQDILANFEDWLPEQLAFQELVQAAIDGDEAAMIEYENLVLTGDVDFAMSREPGPMTNTIPMPHTLFIPNAYINHALNQWKIDHNIAFVYPGGPYATEFLPDFEQSPQSGEFEPPMAIDYEVFEAYLEARSEPHVHLSGLNLTASLIDDYLFIILWLLIIIFFAVNYVKEWDGNQTIRFIKVQPISFKKVHNAKTGANQLVGIVTILFAVALIIVVGSFLNGFGQLDFPYVRYMAKTVAEQASDGTYTRIPTINQYFTIIPLWRYLLEGLALLVAATLFINQFIQSLAIFVKRRWVVIALGSVILAASSALAYLYPAIWLQFLPFYYLNIPDVLTGVTAIQQDFTWLSPYFGMAILLAYTLLLWLWNQFAIRLDERRDIR